MKLFMVYDKNGFIVEKTPVYEQAHAIARNMAYRTGEIYGADNKIGCKSWYGKGGFICNGQYA